MTRILARHIIYEGKDYGLSIAEISDDGQAVTITPYDHETANTVWVNGSVTLVHEPDGITVHKEHKTM